MTVCELVPGRAHYFGSACRCAMPAATLTPDPDPAHLAGLTLPDPVAATVRAGHRAVWLLVLFLAWRAARPVLRRPRRVTARRLVVELATSLDLSPPLMAGRWRSVPRIAAHGMGAPVIGP